jgi:uncharacterized protein YfdQ (DUF2303 family)
MEASAQVHENGSDRWDAFPGRSPLSPDALKSGSEAAAIIEAAQAGTAPHKLDDGVFFADGRLVDLDRYGPAPRRAAGIYKPATLDAFIGYVKDTKGSHGLSVWVNPDYTAPKVVALLNDHDGVEKPAWRDYIVQTDLTLTEEWLHWVGKDGLLMPQAAFAEHVEDGVAEILEPDAAVMLEIAQSIQLAASATIRSAQRLTDGRVKFTYDEEIDGKAGDSGQYEIPTEFKLLIPPFLGEEGREVSARFRYRHGRGGEIQIGYKLNRPNQILLDALEEVVKTLDGEFKDKVYMGAPPA